MTESIVLTVFVFEIFTMSFSNVATTSANQGGPGTMSAAFVEYTNCPQHRSILLSLCAILQAIAIRCPGALVWHNLGEGKSNHILAGSPLDLIGCAPSSLPMPPGVDNQQVYYYVTILSM